MGRRGARSFTDFAQRYGLAVTLCTAALLLSLFVERIGGAHTYVLFVAAVAVAAWRGGRGPALFASVLAVVVIDYFILPPTGTLELSQPEQAVNSIAFLIVTLVVSSIMAALRASNESLALASAESERLADRTLGLQQVTAALSGATTMAEVTHAVLTHGSAMLHADSAALAMQQDGTLSVHLLPRGATEPISVAKGADGSVQARLLGTLRSGEPSWGDTFVALPLTEDASVVGALGFTFASPPRHGTAERALMLLLAQAAVTAMTRAGSFDVERRRRHEAELLTQAREEVLGVVAHDLRNPLHLIASSADLLTESTMDADALHRFAEIAKRATAQMNRLIADLLDMTRLSAGRLTLELDEVAVRTLLEQAEESFRSAARARRLTLLVERDGGDLRVCADAGRVLQVIGNLVGNALKFTPEGGRVVLSAAASSVSGEGVTFSVADTGPGIPADAFDKLFDRFWQARGNDRRGVGLGLTICKGIVEAHGGRIWCESQVGAGSTFHFTLPAAADHAVSTGTRWMDARPDAVIVAH